MEKLQEEGRVHKEYDEKNNKDGDVGNHSLAVLDNDEPRPLSAKAVEDQNDNHDDNGDDKINRSDTRMLDDKARKAIRLRRIGIAAVVLFYIMILTDLPSGKRDQITVLDLVFTIIRLLISLTFFILVVVYIYLDSTNK
ncbi:hypothetical protein VMCG_08389 [Cytospora schulzeri]|uniref:Uncharacterized protein n=1 Tax=Cytospora schulzeri TaxID=448051 RepID=A0A423VR23_9PEZI|nr:hypothetical protein VMCG_08389 [Valsa malicola]